MAAGQMRYQLRKTSFVPFGQRKSQYNVLGCIRTAHPCHVSGPFDIHFYLPRQIDITLDRTGSRGGSSLPGGSRPIQRATVSHGVC